MGEKDWVGGFPEKGPFHLLSSKNRCWGEEIGTEGLEKENLCMVKGEIPALPGEVSVRGTRRNRLGPPLK